MTWKDSLNNLKKVGLDGIKYLDTRHSSVTTAWGVNWDPIFIARDLMQNFYDANRDNPTSIRIEVEEDKVTISAPAKFELARLFYLGSEKGEDDIGQYGEGFKAAAVCLLRDHHIEPIAISGHQVVYIRVNDAKVDGTELEPVVYDYFHHDVSQSHSTEKPHFRGSWFALWLTKGPDLIKDIEIMGDSIGVFLQLLPN